MPRINPVWVILLIGGLFACSADQEQKRKNVLLITFDTTRADRIGVYGNDNVETPTLDSLARDGVLFEQAMASAPITAPSHSTILTGRYPMAHGVRDNGLFVLDASQTTLQDVLRDQGYATGAAIGAFPVTRQFGFAQGFDFFDDHITVANEDVQGERKKPKEDLFFDERRAALVNNAAEPWLRDNADQPFFLWLHYFDPHQPFDPPPPYNQTYLHDLYDGEIAYSDYAFGQVLALLQELGVYDETLIVMTADHGEGLGEHNEETHAVLAYNSTLHVPLIIRDPEFPQKNVRVRQRVGSVDIAPTILALLDVDIPASMQGQSLIPAMEGQPLAGQQYYAENLSPKLTHGWGELRVLYDRDWKYIHGPRQELFDLANDPAELNNLLDDKPDLVAQMIAGLREFIALFAEGQSATQAVSQEVMQKLQSLGYIQGNMASGTVVEESLSTEGIAPQDRATDINRFSAAKQLLFRKRYHDALDYTRKLIEASPDSAMYRELHTIALAFSEQHSAAWEMISTGVKLGASAQQVIWQIVVNQYHLGDTDAAISVLQDYAEYHQSTFFWNGVARLQRASGELSLALEIAQKSLELEPENLDTNQLLAQLYDQLGDLGAAETQFDQLQHLAPLNASVLYNKATFLMRHDRSAEARGLLMQSLRLRPQYPQARYALLVVQLMEGDTVAAQQSFEQLSQMSPDGELTQQAAELLSQP